MECFDAVVLGGGPAGATAAWLLARAGWSVGLLERKAFPRRKVCGEYLSGTNLPLLEHLGIAEAFRARAGPPVRHVGLFAGTACLRADLPRPGGSRGEWGRALGREHLDALLLRGAARAGIVVRQPCAAVGLTRDGDGWACRARCLRTGILFDWRGGVVVAAHGSWEPGPLPSQPGRRPARPWDVLGFKAHFRDADLPEGLMPLLAFPGGYGGLVQTDDGRVSLSCCIRRDRLTALRGGARGGAGETVQGHILESCLGVRRILGGASRCSPWLAAGPVRPGIRLPGPCGIFLVGNAAGEAHPAVAEGISMALQGAWVLARLLTAWRQEGARQEALAGVGSRYARVWRRRFGPRLRVSSAVAHWAMRPGPVAWALPLLNRLPGILSWGARLSGKASQMVRGPW
jgi:2-polyprenyl-6-methoxyphenol hydroxylase-like FAD-dependent oxidoreductase